MNLSTSVKEYELVFKAGYRGELSRMPIALTFEEVEAIRPMLAKTTTKSIELVGADGRLIESIPTSIIFGIRRKDGVANDSERFYICDYGTRHAHFQGCECMDAHKLPGCSYSRFFHENYQIQYNRNITPEMVRAAHMHFAPLRADLIETVRVMQERRGG